MAVVLTVLALTTGMSSTFVQAANEVDSPLVKGTVAEDATGSFAIGDGSKVTSSYENSADAASVDSLAIGTNAEARNRKTVAVGSGAIARGDKSTAIGVGANTAKDSSESLAVGYVAKASGNNAVALGNRSIASEDNTVSVGVSKEDATNNSPAMTRRIVNVSDDIKDSDAATVGQIKTMTGMDSEKGNVVQYDGKDKSAVTFAGTEGTALKNVSDIELKGNSFVDAGLVAGTTTTKSTLFGNATAENNMILGDGAEIYVQGALGKAASVENSMAIGQGAEIHAQSQGSAKHITDSIAFGQDSYVSASNSVAIGAGSTATEEGVVSVGSANNQRRIVNVADGNIGENSIDAVNGSQLYAVREGAVSYGTKMEEDLWGNEKEVTDYSIVTLRGENGTKLTNLAAGEFKDGSTDAVTAGQLYDAGIVPGKAADGSVAIGNGSNVTNINGVAIGNKALVNYSAENGVAIGQGAEVRIDNATAIGQGSRVVSGDGSVALGQGSMVTATDAKLQMLRVAILMV